MIEVTIQDKDGNEEVIEMPREMWIKIQNLIDKYGSKIKEQEKKEK